ncbi:MAG: hypothetical protein DIU79_10510 [Actinobacteria bacterium]|nr:MAG: hypothetical protein DIU79_10510 [Actinomycetota bacterium]
MVTGIVLTAVALALVGLAVAVRRVLTRWRGLLRAAQACAPQQAQVAALATRARQLAERAETIAAQADGLARASRGPSRVTRVNR